MFLLFTLSSGPTRGTGVDNPSIYDDEYYENDGEVQREPMISDPLESFNRKMLSFDMIMLDHVVDPFVRGYRFLVPKFIRKMVGNLGNRVTDIPTFIYSVAMFDYKNSVRTAGVFGVNMTAGLLGLFDPASKIGLRRRETKLGDVFSFYGIASGFYLVLPFTGPTTITDGIGSIGNIYINPLGRNKLDFGKTDGSWTPEDLRIPGLFIQYVSSVETADKLNKDFIKKSFDPYIFIRNAYIENKNHRINIIKNGS
jgi:phospholipid-binding lipoprotein MlaA